MTDKYRIVTTLSGWFETQHRRRFKWHPMWISSSYGFSTFEEAERAIKRHLASLQYSRERKKKLAKFKSKVVGEYVGR